MDQVNKENTLQAGYPSACLLLEYCVQDYHRLQENFNRINEKINVALAFAGVALTIMLGSFDLSSAKLDVKNMTILEVVMTSAELLCLVGRVILIIVATIYLLILLRGRTITVFKSEDIRNLEIYREKEPHAAVWLIDKYTRIVEELRPTIQKKQNSFDKAISIIIIGIIMYAMAVILRNGGF